MPAPLFLYLVPYLHQFSTVNAENEVLFSGNLVQNYIIFVAGTAPSIGAIWDEFSKQHQYQSTIFNAQFAHFCWVQILLRFNLRFVEN